MQQVLRSKKRLTSSGNNDSSYERDDARGFHRSLQQPTMTGMHSVPTLLAGDVASGADYILKGDFRPLAEGFENFRQFSRLWPEFRHVFLGDNSQGDVRAAELMMGFAAGDAVSTRAPSPEVAAAAAAAAIVVVVVVVVVVVTAARTTRSTWRTSTA